MDTRLLFVLRAEFVAIWVFVVLAFVDQLGRLTARHRTFAIGGAVAAAVGFAWSVARAAPLATPWHELAALQVTTMLAAPVAAVTLSRLLAQVHDRRTGLFAGATLVVASPVGLWAVIPKRHALSTLAITLVVASFYASRTAADRTRRRRFRLACYAFVTLFAWLYAMEALLVLVVLVPFDLLTAERNDWRQLGLLALVFLVALGPFFATNIAVTGNPLEPPRALGGYGGQVVESGSTPDEERTARTSGPASSDTDAGNERPTDTDGSDTDAGNRTGSSGSDTDSGPVSLFVTLVVFVVEVGTAAIGRIAWAGNQVWQYIDTGVRILTGSPERVYHIFIRSGRIPMRVVYSVNQQEAIELAFLETMPILGVLAGY